MFTTYYLDQYSNKKFIYLIKGNTGNYKLINLVPYFPDTPDPELITNNIIVNVNKIPDDGGSHLYTINSKYKVSSNLNINVGSFTYLGGDGSYHTNDLYCFIGEGNTNASSKYHMSFANKNSVLIDNNDVNNVQPKKDETYNYVIRHTLI